MKTLSPLDKRIKRQIIAKEHLFFAIVQPGFEEIAKNELEELGINSFEPFIEGGVEFNSKLNDCYNVNICSRTINRILIRLTKFKAENFTKLKRRMSEFPWELYFKENVQVNFSTYSKRSRLYHTDGIEEECIQGIKDRLSEYNIQTIENSENIQTVHIRIVDDICTVSLDTTGDLLYKRGNKTLTSTAPIRETLAALILKAANVKKYETIIDPMCGSGTFSLEANDILKNNFPNIKRNFPFKNWPSFKDNNYQYLVKNIKDKTENPLFHIFASDINQKAIEIAEGNFKNIKTNNLVLSQKDFFNNATAYKSNNKKTLIVLNPPYGKRIDNVTAQKIFRNIGNTIRTHYEKCGYAIITTSIENEKVLSLPYDKKIVFKNGGIKVAVIIKY